MRRSPFQRRWRVYPWPRQPQWHWTSMLSIPSQPINNRTAAEKRQYWTRPSVCRASGRVGLVHVLGVCGSTLRSCSSEHWSKSSCRQPARATSPTAVRSRLRDPPRRSESHPGFRTWVSLAQGCPFPIRAPSTLRPIFSFV